MRCLSSLQTESSQWQSPSTLSISEVGQQVADWQEETQPSTSPNKPRTAQWPAWKTGKLSPPRRERCMSDTFCTQRATRVTACSGSHCYNNDDTANDNKHKIKTKARSPAATAVALRNGELLTARYCLPSDSIVWVLCTNIY